MHRAQVSTIAIAIALCLTLSATAQAQMGPGLPSGSMLAGRPQDDVATAPAATRFGASMVTDAFTARLWIIELAAAQQARFAKRADVKARRLVAKRTPTWAP